MGVNALLNIGNHALFANQAAINVTGNNIANVNTDGYSRQSVRFEEFAPINYRPGQLGMGAYAAEVYRNFDRFAENSFLDRYSQQQRWNEQSTTLQSVQNLFNESNRNGINDAMSKFFKGWQSLAQNPDSMADREAILAQSENLALLLRDAKTTLQNTQVEMDQYIRQSVDEVNNTVEALRKVCQEAAATHQPGVNNANSLLDERDRLVRKLSEYVDIEVLDRGVDDFTVMLKGGQPLVGGQADYSLKILPAQIENKLQQPYDGELVVSGNDSYEYTMEYVSANEFRVSLDGGKNWLRNDDGSTMLYTTPPLGETLKVKNLEISFTHNNLLDGDTPEFKPGDSFTIVPKNGLYWDSPTRPPLNITPQTYMDGTDNTSRLTGGKLAAYYNVRDYNVGRYADKLDALANSLIWEVNSLHSQGSGLQELTGLAGTTLVGKTDVALGSGMAQMPFSERLTPGNLNIFFYDATNKQTLSKGTIDFDPSTTEIDNFDPQKHTLEDVVSAINSSFPDPNDKNIPPRNMITASIEGGKLQLASAPGVTFKMGNDSTGLMAALGVNTFFSGSNATDMGVNPFVRQNPSSINNSRVDGNTEGNRGDSAIASAIGGLASTEVRISTTWETSTQSLSNYYIRLVGVVGSETQNAMFNDQYNKALAKDLDERCASVSGVSLDEEMTNLIRFQHSYTAAAKLITTADKMLEIVLGLKQ